MTPKTTISAKPRFRFDYRRRNWRAVYYTPWGAQTGGRSFPSKPLCRCEICGGPAVKVGQNALCPQCSALRGAEVYTARIQYTQHRWGQPGFPRLRDLRCADCNGPATEWEHRDWREPLKVEPICRGCNSRRGRAMTAYEASFSQRTNNAPKPLHVDPICQPHQRASAETACAGRSFPI